jgi:outer membrane protein assembly factor BamB
VTGDLVPILEWRWRSTAVESIQSSAPAGVVADRVLQSTNDYAQFLGPDRTGILAWPLLDRDWSAHPPEVVWRQPVGAAWSGFAVAGEYAVTQEQRGEEEMVVCHDLGTGAVLWAHGDPERYATTIAGEGPRATPTIDGGRVFSMGATGRLNCLDLATGSVIWSRDAVTENGARVPDWGITSSPLVTGEHVIVSVGGSEARSLVAYEKESGAFAWGGGDGSVGYSAPEGVVLDGSEQVVVFNNNGVASHEPGTGRVLWEYPWKGGHPHVAIPLVLPGNRLLVSSGYGTGSELLLVRGGDSWEVEKLWKSTRLKSKFANLLYRGESLYGLDDGILVCLETETGALRWKDGRYGHGQMILTGDLLLMTAESGDLVLIEPSPEERRELARFAVFDSKTWNPPALAGDLLLMRNDREAACLRLPLRADVKAGP